MDACGCDDFASFFDRPMAERAARRYRSGGPDRTTRMLLDLIRPLGVAGATVLDVGGGIGVIDHELLRDGAGSAVLVDASADALDVARREAAARDELDRLEFIRGDFTRRSGEIGEADIVTLDRVVCCFGDPVSLVGQSAARARRVYGLVLPRDRWLIRLGVRLLNFGLRLRGSAYRSYAHRNDQIDRLVEAAGLRPATETGTFMWRVVVYVRPAGA